MKNIILIIMFSIVATSLFAQVKAKAKTSEKEERIDSMLISAEINLLYGGLNQTVTTANTLPNYLNAVNSNIGSLKFSAGSTIGFDIEGAYWFKKFSNWGVGLGVIYLMQSGDLTLDKFHVEYQSTDFQNTIFRQVITANNMIKEELKISNFNIPLVVKFKKNNIYKAFGVSVDAGIMYNLQLQNNFTTDANFNYEAIYQFNQTGKTGTAVYDNGIVPNKNKDWMITQQALSYPSNPYSAVDASFQNYRTQGYNVGLNVNPSKNTGTVSNKSMSIGFLVKPQINYTFNTKFAVNFGASIMYQPFTNSVSNTYRLTDKVGSYSSVLNSVSASSLMSVGIIAGVRYTIK